MLLRDLINKSTAWRISLTFRWER